MKLAMDHREISKDIWSPMLQPGHRVQPGHRNWDLVKKIVTSAKMIFFGTESVTWSQLVSPSHSYSNLVTATVTLSQLVWTGYNIAI